MTNGDFVLSGRKVESSKLKLSITTDMVENK